MPKIIIPMSGSLLQITLIQWVNLKSAIHEFRAVMPKAGIV